MYKMCSYKRHHRGLSIYKEKIEKAWIVRSVMNVTTMTESGKVELPSSPHSVGSALSEEATADYVTSTAPSPISWRHSHESLHEQGRSEAHDWRKENKED